MPISINIIAAKSNSGKTTIIENVIPLLQEKGLKVAALKGNIQHYDFDTHGKDSFRFAKAGANISGITTPDSFILVGEKLSTHGTEAAIKRLTDMDLILIEGDKASDNPKIEVMRKSISSIPLLNVNTIAVMTDMEDLQIAQTILKIDDYEGLADMLYNLCLGDERPTSEQGLTHFDHQGRPHMVDVSDKEESLREAYACCEIKMSKSTLQRIKKGTIEKGDVLSVAQIAAINGVKETSRSIPLAHPLLITGVSVNFCLNEIKNCVEVSVRVRSKGQTGVEMEALTGAGVAALTIYDMCKAMDKEMIIDNLRLMEKKGGRSGHYIREQNNG